MQEVRMRTYVAEINGEAIIAFRAEDDDVAYEEVHGSGSEEDGLKAALLEYERADGAYIWNGQDDIGVRPASDAEHDRWQEVLRAWTGSAADGAAFDPDAGDDPDNLHAFLIQISDPAEDAPTSV